MQCGCSCFVSTTKSFDDMILVPSKPINCLICHIEIKDKCVVCTSCTVPLGHAICVKQWVQRRGTCPNCSKEST